jgi:hypothetical protein
MDEDDDDAVTTCMEYEIRRCEFGRGRPRPHPICYHHAVQFFITEDPSPLVGMTLDDPRVVRALMDMSKKGWSKIVNDDGEVVSDWPHTLDQAEKVQALSVLDNAWLFDQAEVSEATNKLAHPKSEEVGEGEIKRDRLYANAYILHVMAALVSFIRAHHRKPKGEEFHEWLDLGWTRYVDAAGLRAGGPAVAPSACMPASCPACTCMGHINVTACLASRNRR